MKGGDGKGQLITGEFSGESVFECAHAAMHAWYRNWYWESGAILTVKYGERKWRVRSERVSKWAAKQYGWD